MAAIGDEQALGRRSLALELAALEVFLDQNAPKLYAEFLEWYRELALKALREYSVGGIEAGEDALRADLFRPALFTKARGSQWAYTIVRWHQLLSDGARPILEAAIPECERRVQLCELVLSIRERYWPLGPGVVTPDCLPHARTAEGFANAALGEFFLPAREGNRSRDRRSVGTTVRRAKETVGQNQPPKEDWTKIEEGLTQLFADLTVLPARMLTPRALRRRLNES